MWCDSIVIDPEARLVLHRNNLMIFDCFDHCGHHQVILAGALTRLTLDCERETTGDLRFNGRQVFIVHGCKAHFIAYLVGVVDWLDDWWKDVRLPGLCLRCSLN